MNKQLQLNRKTKLSMALALALGVGMAATSMTAQAVYLNNNDGLGDAGIFQYYTVNGGWQTFIRIINTSDDAASVKVRFREAANSREVLDFTIFLSPRDMWSGWTAPNANGGPGVVTNDTSCLYPAPQGNNTGYNGGTEEGFWYQPNGTLGANFLTRAFNAPYDDGALAADADRLTEGHIEVIGIARHEWDSPFGLAVSHGENGKPANCGTARDLFDRDETDDRGLRNVLAMNGYIVNVENGQGGGFDPDILANFCSDTSCSFVEDSIRSATDPDLDSARPDGYGVDNFHQDDFGPGATGTKQKGLPYGGAFTSNTTAVTGGVDAVSFEFMRSSVINEWAADPVQAAVITDYYTQWVLTFPTKHYYVDLQTDTELRDDVSPTLVDPGSDASSPAVGNNAIMPFSNEFDYYGESCEPYRMRMWNREEEYKSFTSPAPLIDLDLCNETNVLVFDPLYNDEGLASNFAATIDINAFPTNADGTLAVRGWASMDFASNDENLNLGFADQGGLIQNRRILCNGSNADTGEECLIGLPVTGWMLTIYNTTAGNIKNHTTINAHKYAREQLQD